MARGSPAGQANLRGGKEKEKEKLDSYPPAAHLAVVHGELDVLLGCDALARVGAERRNGRRGVVGQGERGCQAAAAVRGGGGAGRDRDGLRERG